MSFFRAIGEAIGRRAATDALNDMVQSGRLTKMVDDRVGETIERILASPEYAWFRFIKAIQWKLHKADPTLSAKDSMRIARNAYLQFLHDEKIEFGDPRYDWSRAGAETVAQEYEIEHWESRP